MLKVSFVAVRRGLDAMKGSFILRQAATVRLGLQPVGKAMWQDGNGRTLFELYEHSISLNGILI